MEYYCKYITLHDNILKDKNTCKAFEKCIKDKKYIGHGTHVLTFSDVNKKIVTKCCFKHSGTLMEDPYKFSSTLESIRQYNEVLFPLDIIYVDENLVIYTQEYVKPMTSTNAEFILFMFKFIRKMIRNGMHFPDIYFRNFSDKCKLFDFHNYESLDKNINFFITNIYNNVLKFINPDQVDIKRIDYILEHNYSFPPCQQNTNTNTNTISTFLKLLSSYRQNKAEILQILDEIIFSFKVDKNILLILQRILPKYKEDEWILTKKQQRDDILCASFRERDSSVCWYLYYRDK